MRRGIIYGLLGLLMVVVVLDFQTTTDDHPSSPDDAILPTLAIPATGVPITATPAATINATREAVIMTLTQMHIDGTTSALYAASLKYTLQTGDTPFALSERFDVPVEAILKANNIVDPTRLRVGQELLIPVGIPLDEILPLVTPAPLQVAVASYLTPTATIIPFELGDFTPVFGAPPPAINGVPFDSIIVLPGNVQAHIRDVFTEGHRMGNNPRAFSMLGDSTIEQPYFLGRFDSGPYNLGPYNYLKPVIDYYSGSFSRQSVAVRRGLHTWSVLDPMWAPKPDCQPGEHMLACEFRLNHPSLLFIRLGSNDAGIPDSTDENLREIVQFALDQGVIPILGTKADRHEGPGNINNIIIRKIAADYAVPLWDFDLVAQTLPAHGLDQDGVHLTMFYAHDYNQPDALQRGYGAYNLTALLMLDMLWRELYTTPQS